MYEELYHHGIKGQRWGVRRFQNPDGTLTEAGKKHYAKPNNRPVKQIVRKFQNKDGTLTDLGKEVYKQRLEALDSDDWWSVNSSSNTDKKLADQISATGIIPKGTVLYRQTQTPEALGTERKYVTLSLDASNEYSNGDMLTGVWGNNSRSYVYRTKKPLRIATDREVEDYIFSKHPKEETRLKKLRDGRDYIYQNLDRRLDPGNNDGSKTYDSIDYLAKSYKSKVDSFMHQYYRSMWADENKLVGLRDRLYTQASQTHRHFKELGYDAVSDIEDGGLKNNSLYSIIILNPKDSMDIVEDMPSDNFYEYWKDNRYD